MILDIDKLSEADIGEIPGIEVSSISISMSRVICSHHSES